MWFSVEKINCIMYKCNLFILDNNNHVFFFLFITRTAVAYASWADFLRRSRMNSFLATIFRWSIALLLCKIFVLMHIPVFSLFWPTSLKQPCMSRYTSRLYALLFCFCKSDAHDILLQFALETTFMHNYHKFSNSMIHSDTRLLTNL